MYKTRSYHVYYWGQSVKAIDYQDKHYRKAFLDIVCDKIKSELRNENIYIHRSGILIWQTESKYQSQFELDNKQLFPVINIICNYDTINDICRRLMDYDLVFDYNDILQ